MEKNATQALKVYYEDIVPERSTVWFHPVTPLVCTVTERNQVKITNYESGKCLAFFDIFSGPQALADPRCARPFNCIDAIFVDKYSLIWNAGSSDVASGLALKFKTHSDIQTLILVDRCSLVRWDYCTEKWALTDILFDGRIGATKAVLYDENVLVLGFEDGTLKLFNYMAGSWVAVLKDSHKSAISQLLVFARDLTSKPLVVTAESAGAVFCWNMESQAVAFKFSEMAKGKSMLSTFKKDQVKGLLYNKFYGYFLIYTESAITVWNSFTGFKMFGFSLTDRGQPLGIKSLTATGCFGYSLTHYIVSVDSRLYHFDLIDNANVVPEVQGRMLKYPKNSQEFAIEVQQVTHIEGDFEFQHSTFSSNFIKARCNQPNSVCVLGDETLFSDHIKSHPLYFSRTPSVLVKQSIDSQGHIRAISQKDVEIIQKSENEDFNSESQAKAPKSVFLNVYGTFITANIVEFYSDESGKLDYMINSSILHKNADFSYSHVKVELAFNGKYFWVLEHSARKLQLFHVHNGNLRLQSHEEPAAHFLHPLGEITKFYDIVANDAAWLTDALEFCAVVYEIKKNGQIAKDFELFRKSECKSVLCLFAIKDGTEEAIPLRKIEVEEACRVKSMFSYLIFPSDKKLYDLQLKTELTILEEETLVPNHVLLSYSRAIVYQVYDRWIDIVFTHPSDHLKHVVKRQSNPFQILSVYVWEDLLFYTDLYYIWLCLPTLYDREPIKIKLAAVHPHGKEPVKPANICYIVGIIDQKLVVTNSFLDLLPIDLNSPVLNFYFKLKAGKSKMAFEEAQEKPSIELEAIDHMTQFLKEFKLAMLFKPFALVYLKSYRSLLRDVFEQPAEIQYEYVMLLIKLLYQLTTTQKAAILEELALYDRQIEANDKLREVLSKVDL